MVKINSRLMPLPKWLLWAALPFIGALASAAMPPLGMYPALFLFSVAFAGLERARSIGQGALWIGLFAYGFYLPQLTWIHHALSVDADKFGWLTLPAVLGIPLYLALCQAVAGVLYKIIAPRPRWAAMGFAALWACADFLQSEVDFGFPWALPVYALDGLLPLQQAHAVLGAFGLNFFVVWVATLPALLWQQRRREAILLAGLLVGTWVLGGVRLAILKPEPLTTVRIVQPNIPQRLKWNQEAYDNNLASVLALLGTPYGSTLPSMVVLPEAALPVDPQRDFLLRLALVDNLPPGASLILGALREWQAMQGSYYYNTMFSLNGSGTIVGLYDKRHLVPFGEYIPFRKTLPLERIAPLPGDLFPGTATAPMLLADGSEVSGIICYESAFSGNIRLPMTSRNIKAIVQVTNDAWFGASAGPYQHLAISRTRAIEEGVPLIRAANTGISAVIDPLGRVVAKLGLDQRGVLDAPLPGRLTSTMFLRLHYILGGIWCIPLLIIIVSAFKREFKKR
ncbi:MAG: apolipoprotein N-acyltransferase [Holosporales bacterium]|jgi:apolipoprotein N-acyltransferase